MLATEEHKKSQRGALDFGIAGLNSRESRAYTIQGWIKGVNSNTMSALRDPGRDGDVSLGGNTHAKVATDAFGYTLGYFAGDYNPIGTFTTAGKSEASTAGSDLLAARSDLWNGNISHMVTCLPKATDYAANQTITPEAFGSAYQYDQLNRLSSSRVFTNINTTTNQWQSGAGTNPTAYATDYTYDAMGNILTQKRNGGGASATALDELTYNYHTTTDGLVSNRLYQVNDVVSAGNYTDDIDDQGTFNNTHSTIEAANNYGYDELGNLVRDAQEDIASIEWTVYGKMKKITRNSGSSKADLEFGYDASGNRLWKKVTPKGSGAVISTYYYLRDAQGNEMCRYVKYTNTTSQLMYVAQEHSIYGSSRVGVDGRKDTLYMGAVYTPTWGGVGTSRRALGLKSFELANHLGNVLVTVSDKPVYKVSSATIFFQPEITSSSDYYPFGAPINGRSFSSAEYRFGFNTQEKTDEISGTGNHFTAQFWEYDGRLGRRWNIDPVTKPWESLYACLSDNPILLNDQDGNDPGNPQRYIVVGGDDLTKIGNKFGVSVDNLVKWNNIANKHYIQKGQTLIVNDPTKVKQPDGFVWWQSENSPSTNSPNSNQPLKPLSTTASNITQNAESVSGTDWSGVADASLGIIGGGLEVLVGVFGEGITGGVSTIAIFDGWGRIGINTMRLAAFSNGNTPVAKALPSNLGGLTGKIYDIGILNKNFSETGPAQNTLGISNDAATFIIGGGSNISVILNPKSNSQLIRATSGYVLYHYDNFKPIWQNKK